MSQLVEVKCVETSSEYPDCECYDSVTLYCEHCRFQICKEHNRKHCPHCWHCDAFMGDERACPKCGFIPDHLRTPEELAADPCRAKRKIPDVFSDYLEVLATIANQPMTLSVVKDRKIVEVLAVKPPDLAQAVSEFYE